MRQSVVTTDDQKKMVGLFVYSPQFARNNAHKFPKVSQWKNLLETSCRIENDISKWLHATKQILWRQKPCPKQWLVWIQPQYHRMMCHLMRIVCMKNRCDDVSMAFGKSFGLFGIGKERCLISIKQSIYKCFKHVPVPDSHLFAYRDSQSKKKKQHAVSFDWF